MTTILIIIIVIKDVKLIPNTSKEGPNRLVEMLTLVSYILEVPGSKISPRGKFCDSISNYTLAVSFNIPSIPLVTVIQSLCATQSTSDSVVK